MHSGLFLFRLPLIESGLIRAIGACPQFRGGFVTVKHMLGQFEESLIQGSPRFGGWGRISLYVHTLTVSYMKLKSNLLFSKLQSP